MKRVQYDGSYESYANICHMAGGVPVLNSNIFVKDSVIGVKGFVFTVGEVVEEAIFYSPTAPTDSAQINGGNAHPFLNPNNPHYAMVDGVEAIAQMEKMYTVDELKAWAKITAMKYRLRIGAKDDTEKEVNKIKEYEAYYKYLEAKQCE